MDPAWRARTGFDNIHNGEQLVDKPRGYGIHPAEIAEAIRNAPARGAIFSPNWSKVLGGGFKAPRMPR